MLARIVIVLMTTLRTWGRPTTSACIERTELLGLTKDWSEEADLQLEGDLVQLSQMSLMQIAYDRPSSVIVCADDTYVHGIQFNLQKHPVTEGEHADSKLSEQTIEAIKALNTQWDTNSSAYEGTRMAMLGTYTGSCQKLVIPDNDKIVFVVALSDSDRLRTLTFRLASGAEKSYGGFTDLRKDEMVKQTFDFSNKTDILGVFGHTVPDPKDLNADHIVSLGFIVNKCPGRSLLEHEAALMAKKGLIPETVELFEEAAADEIVAMSILISVGIGCLFVASYYVAKNRGKICKKQSKSKSAKPNHFETYVREGELELGSEKI